MDESEVIDMTKAAPADDSATKAADVALPDIEVASRPNVVHPHQDGGGKKIKTEKKEKPKMGRQQYPKGQGKPPEYDVRARRPYDVARTHSFCPKADFKKFIYQIDELVRLDEELNYTRDKIHNNIGCIYRHYGLDPPSFEAHQARSHRQYVQVVRTYHEVKRQLLEPGVRQKATFDNLVSALEILGCVILNPYLLTYVEYSNDEKSAFLRTFPFTTDWTQEHFDKIIWSPDGEVSFQQIKKDQIKFQQDE